MEFNDRRPSLRVTDEDYETPVTRSSVTAANARLRSAMIAPDAEHGNHHIDTVIQRRYRERKREGQEPYRSVGEYLEAMHGC